MTTASERSDPTRPWPQFLYDLYEWCFWEPRRIGRLPDPESKGFAHYAGRLRATDEPLNHILRLFMALAPDEVAPRLAEAAGLTAMQDHYALRGRDFLLRYDLPVNSTQPDFVFDGQHSVLSVEMKLAARTDAVQLAKYLWLHSRIEAGSTTPRRHAMIYLGPADFASLWPDRQALSPAARLAQAIEALPTRIGRERVAVEREPVERIARHFALGFLSYRDLDEVLTGMRADISGTGWEASAARSLVDGLRAELDQRGLVQ